MADALDLAIAAGPPRIDFSPLSNLFGDYTNAVKNKAQVDSIQAFRNGVPTLPDGSPDYGAMSTRLYQTGDFSNANALGNLSVQRAPFQLLPGAINLMGGNTGATSPLAGSPATSGVPGISNSVLGYYAKLANGESGNNPNAISTAPGSHASGLFQFQPGTWDAVSKAHPELGLTPNGMLDPGQQWKAVQALTADNAAKLSGSGFDVNGQNLYLSHFLGADGASAFLRGLSANPSAPATSLASPAAVKANQSLFFQNGQPLSAAQFYTRLTGRFADNAGAPASANASAVSANNPALVGLIPPGTDPNVYIQGLRQYAAALSISPQTAALGKVFSDRAAAIEKALEPTPAQKDYYADRRPGESMSDYQSRVEQQKGLAKDTAEMYADARKDYKASQAATYRLGLIDKSIDELGSDWMGTTAETRGKTARAWNTLTSFLPDDIKKNVQIDPRKIASFEDFTKQTQTLGFELARTLGSREAQMIVQQATNSVPNVGQSPLGAKLVASSLKQAAQRQQDYYEFLQSRAKSGTLLGADADFNRANPVEKYVDTAIKSVMGNDYQAGKPAAAPKFQPGQMIVQNGNRFRVNPDGSFAYVGRAQ
ncbi:MAG TPA: hypothetical protein VFB29_00430 [Pseudolabrys sp.]|nr:hypothetical protein [Pseudolabrys sp.]